MRFHIVSLPHTQVTSDYCWCAYTSKVRRFCNMMSSLGHEVFLYGGTQHECAVEEFISVVSEEDRQRWFGHYDWDRESFSGWEPGAEWWVSMNANASREIAARKQSGDFIGIIAGRCQESIKALNPDLISVEWGVGYEGILPGFRVFESYAWMHYLYGKLGIDNGCFYDTVIPNAYEPDELKFSNTKDDYLLYLGRLTPRKGLEVVELLVKRGHKVLIAGQGDIRIQGAEYVGVVRGDQKRELLAKAKAVLVPTFYIEPFGGVAIEAALSGTPVITTDFGAFSETVRHGINGYRCSNMDEFYMAADNLDELDPPCKIRSYADKYLTDNVRLKYQVYFQRLRGLRTGGWYGQQL